MQCAVIYVHVSMFVQATLFKKCLYKYFSKLQKPVPACSHMCIGMAVPVVVLWGQGFFPNFVLVPHQFAQEI